MGSFCLEDTSQALASPNWEPAKHSRSFCERAAMVFFDADGALINRMVCLCAEPGTGRRDILTCALSLASQRGVQVLRRNLEAYNPESACRYLTKKARQVEGLGGYVLVAFDGIPASDEFCVTRQARALRRMWDSGASVIFSIGPEARQLLEELPECREVTSQALFAHGAAGLADSFSRELFRYTRAIPSLIASVASRKESDSHGGEGGAVLLPSYFDALGELAELSVRSGLADEERELRLGMLLLGRGHREDLVDVVGRAPTDVLESISRYAPVFGLSDDLEEFVTLPIAVPGAYAMCLRHLLSACSLYPEVAGGCLRVLTRRGELSQAAVLARVPECDGASGAIRERGAAFIDAGEVELVRHAIGLGGDQEDPLVEKLRFAVSAVADARPRLAQRRPGLMPSDYADETLLLVDSRRVLRGIPPLTSADARADSELARALSLHVGAVSLMVRGAFTLALGLLTGGCGNESGSRLASALLALDCDAAHLLAGGTEDSGAEGNSWAEELLEKIYFTEDVENIHDPELPHLGKQLREIWHLTGEGVRVDELQMWSWIKMQVKAAVSLDRLRDKETRTELLGFAWSQIFAGNTGAYTALAQLYLTDKPLLACSCWQLAKWSGLNVKGDDLEKLDAQASGRTLPFITEMKKTFAQAEQGDQFSCWVIAAMYFYGIILPADLHLSEKYLRMALVPNFDLMTTELLAGDTYNNFSRPFFTGTSGGLSLTALHRRCKRDFGLVKQGQMAHEHFAAVLLDYLPRLCEKLKRPKLSDLEDYVLTQAVSFIVIYGCANGLSEPQSLVKNLPSDLSPLLFWNSLFTLASQRPDVLHSHEDLGWSIRQLQIYKHVKAKMEEMPQFKDHPVLTYLQGMFALRPMAIKPQLQLAAQYFGRAVIWGSVGAAAWSFADLNPLVGAKVLSDPQQLPQAELKGGDQKTGGDGTITVQAVQ